MTATVVYASTTYQYDNLYRLTRASSTNATTTNWLETYTYNDIGNLLTKSDIGSYTYAGTGFANPHAPTTINGVSYSYDNAGNLTTKGTQTFTWDAWNRLQETTNAGTSTAYTYDHTGQRVSQSINRGSGTTTTIYWSKLYQTEGSTTTLSIFLPDGTLLATVEGNGVSTTTSIIHTDHLNSVALTSDKNGTLSELSAYYPYGAHRITDLPSSGQNVQRGYIGQYEDGVTELSYLNARYYEGSRGQFLSQDPLVRRMGTDSHVLQKLLIDPQQMNTYSYARNNPVNLSDPSGEASTGAILAQIRSLFVQIYSLMAQLATAISRGGGSSSGSGTAKSTPVVSGGGGSAQIPSGESNYATARTATWDPVTNSRISGLDSRVQQPATNFINDVEENLKIRLRVTDGFRSNEEQDKLYNQSRTNPPTGPWATNAIGGRSPHNYGMAIDVVPMVDGKPDYSKPISSEIAAYGKEQGFSWGGEWTGKDQKQDFPHFEMATFGTPWQP